MQKLNSTKKIIALFIGLLTVDAAVAADDAPKSGYEKIEKSAQDISNVKQEINYTKALTDLEKARFQLERARKGIFDDSQTTQNQTGMPGMYNPPPMNITQPKTVSEDNKEINKTPLLAAVYGSSKLKAQFKLSDGSNIEASAGDVLPGGYQVKSISVDRVQLIHDGKVINVGS